MTALTPGMAAPTPANNPAPLVVPSLNQWTGGEGNFTLKATSRIVVSAQLTTVGEEFAQDLLDTTGLNLPVVTSAGAPGDISLILNAADAHAAGGELYAKEGYKLTTAADGVKVTAPTETGVYYGTRSILQILAQANGRTTLPVGSAVDWPEYEARGFVLDVGRRFFTADFINDYIKMMSYYKLNRFQIHLNDNEIFSGPDKDWRNLQQGFRLKSENPVYAGLASADGSYDRADWDSFEATAATRGVRIIPEIDVPAHSAAIIKWRPEIGLDSGKSDHLDLGNPATTPAIKGIFDEFMPWFQGPEVNFGADEYPGSSTHYRDFYNAMAAHIRAAGKIPGVWASYKWMSGSIAGYDMDVVPNCWSKDWYPITMAAADKVKCINTSDATLYVVPFANYYHGKGLDNAWLYQNWLPHMAGDLSVAPGDLRGAMFAVWNDLVNLDYDQQDVHGLIERSFPVVAQKTWKAAAPARSYADFNATLDRIGMGPGLKTVKDTTPLAGEADLALGKTAVTTSAKAGHPASNLTDGDPTTRWESSAAGPAAITIDLGKVETTRGIAVEWAANAPEAFAVESSVDGIFWDRVARQAAAPGLQDVTFPTTSARYIRLADLSSAAGSVSAWHVGVLGPVNAALGATAASSGIETANFPEKNAFDGDPSTRWSAKNVAQRWISGDFGSAKPVSEVTIAWEAASARDYTVSVSLDGTEWTQVAAKTGMAGGARTDVISIEKIQARFIKVDIQAATMGQYLSIIELAARDKSATALGVSGTLTGTPNGDGKFDVEPTVALQATGSAAAEAAIEYRIGEGGWQAYTAPFTVAGYTLTTLDYRAVSGAETFAGFAVLDLDTPGASPSPEPSASATPEPSETPGTPVPSESASAEPTHTQTTDPATAEPSHPATTPTADSETPAPSALTSSAGSTTAATTGNLANTGAAVSLLMMAGLMMLGLGSMVVFARRVGGRH